MLRHRLASVFEPRSLIVITDVSLPISESVPAYLVRHTTYIQFDSAASFAQMIATESIESEERKDLAAICVHPDMLVTVLAFLERKPPRALILLPTRTVDNDPKEQRAFMLDWARRHDCMLLGPRAFGVQRPHLKLNLSKHPILSHQGRVAVVSQSRMLLMSIMDWANDVDLGLSAAISLGEAVDIDLPEIIEYLATDPRTDSIALYIDKLGSGRELVSAIRMASSVKPVLVLRAGRASPELLGNDAVLDAALRRAGAVRVDYFVELFAALKALSYARRPKGGRIVIFGNGRAATSLTLDAMGVNSALSKASLSSASARDLKHVLGKGAIVKNPVISYAPLTGEQLIESLKVMVDDAGVDAIMVMLAPDELCDMPQVVEQLAAYAKKAPKPIVTSILGEATMRPLRKLLNLAGMPAFRTPETALGAMMALCDYFYNQQLLQQLRIPLLQTAEPDFDGARVLLAKALAENRKQLEPQEAIRLLNCFHVGISWEEDEEDERFSVEDDVPAIMISVQRDPVFGPWIWFGEGGHKVVFSARDKGIDLPPLNTYLAGQLIKRSRVWRQELQTYVEPHIFEKLQRILELVADLVSEFPAIEKLEINPVILGYRQVHARQVQVTLCDQKHELSPRDSGYGHMAIFPYPHYLTEYRTFEDEKEWVLRPIRPEDADALQTFIRDLSEKSRYMRFVSMMRELTPKMLARYTYVDYHRELALVATIQVPNEANRGLPQEVIIGLAHYLRNADGVGAEYALVVGDGWQKRGLGRTLMNKLIQAAGKQGLAYIEGVVLASNKPMLSLMTSLGMRNDPDEEDPSMRRVWMPLDQEN
ncbi:MAG: GNAT family N-acetyltransferase [Alcaligenaceae bacterium]|nr:GNAT family N-acetyltransferase [Alcaligenaceae bacterium]